MRNVLVINSGIKYGGVEKLLLQLATELKGKVNFFITYKSPSSIDRKVALSFEEAGVKLICLHEKKEMNHISALFSYIFKPFKTFRNLKRIIKEYSIDTIHTCIDTYSGIYLKAAKKLGIENRIAHSHTILDLNFRKRLSFSRLVTIYEKKLMNIYSTKRVSCSKSSGKSFFDRKFETILNPLVGIDLEKAKASCKIKSETIRIAQIGRMDDNKNFLFSLEIMNKLKNKKIDFSFSIVSNYTNKKYFEKVKEFVKNNNLTNEVKFLPPDYDKDTLFKNIDVLLLPSKQEGFGLVALESQAYSIPCIVSDSTPDEIDYGMCEFVSLTAIDEWIDKICNINKREYTLDKSIYDNTIENYSMKIFNLYNRLE